jgi:hypothetical protein
MDMIRIEKGTAKYYLMEGHLLIGEKKMKGQEFIDANRKLKESGSKQLWKSAAEFE